MAFQDTQVTRVSRVLQGLLDLQEWMEPGDPKDTRGTQHGTVATLGQRVSQAPPDVQDILENLASGASQVFKGPMDHLDGQDHLAPLDHQGVQVIQECLGRKDIPEQWGILDQEAPWGIQERRVFLGLKVPLGHRAGTAYMV